MNREERRREEKLQKKADKSCGKQILVTEKQLSEIVYNEMARVRAQIVDDATRKVVERLKVLFFVALHDKFGFGQERLNKLDQNIDLHATALAEGLASFEDLKKICEVELGMVSDCESFDGVK